MTELTEDQVREKLNQSSVDKLREAQDHQRWLSVSFYVDENNQIQIARTTCEFIYEDFPKVVEMLKNDLDAEVQRVFSYHPQEALPLAPHLQNLMKMEGDDGEDN